MTSIKIFQKKCWQKKYPMINTTTIAVTSVSATQSITRQVRL